MSIIGFMPRGKYSGADPPRRLSADCSYPAGPTEYKPSQRADTSDDYRFGRRAADADIVPFRYGLIAEVSVSEEDRLGSASELGMLKIEQALTVNGQLNPAADTFHV